MRRLLKCPLCRARAVHIPTGRIPTRTYDIVGCLMCGITAEYPGTWNRLARMANAGRKALEQHKKEDQR